MRFRLGSLLWELAWRYVVSTGLDPRSVNPLAGTLGEPVWIAIV